MTTVKSEEMRRADYAKLLAYGVVECILLTAVWTLFGIIPKLPSEADLAVSLATLVLLAEGAVIGNRARPLADRLVRRINRL